jgi:hypothetical protein
VTARSSRRSDIHTSNSAEVTGTKSGEDEAQGYLHYCPPNDNITGSRVPVVKSICAVTVLYDTDLEKKSACNYSEALENTTDNC